MKLLVTGASGLLGKAISKQFSDIGGNVQLTRMSLTNSSPSYTQLDLLNEDAVNRYFAESWQGQKGDVVIHCAAERRPDVAEKNPESTQKLNAEVPGLLALLAKQYGFLLIYISTDYVFDGTSAPYKPESATNPVNLYGRTKRDGENAALGVIGAEVVALRVPILYGLYDKTGESFVNRLLGIIENRSGGSNRVDHYQTRYPTNVFDVGRFLVKLIALEKRPLPRIIHFSAPEPFTQYEMALLFSVLLGLPASHIIPEATDPQSRGLVMRPRDCKLDTTETEILVDGVPGGVLGCVGFEEWWKEQLGVQSVGRESVSPLGK